MLDIDLYRRNPEIIRESQRRKFATVQVVDEIIILDQLWRQRKYDYDCVQRVFNKINNSVAKLKISGADATEQIKQAEIIKQEATKKGVEVGEAFASLQDKLLTVGNLIHDSVRISDDEAFNEEINVWGEKPVTKRKSHVDLVELLDIVDTKRGAKLSGARGFLLKGYGVALNQALI
ncbi:Class I and II aminoacyl-tRNA synthetase tRNA-binding arm, partial [Arabidopsis thaliana x Arabidopsis arenosa]